MTGPTGPAMATTLSDVMAAMRSGNLADATRRIQAMLAGGPDAHAAPAGGANAGAGTGNGPGNGTGKDGDVIDLVPERTRITRPAHSRRAHDMALLRFDGAAGGLHYRLHRPPSLPDGAPLVVMLHGCTQDSADFARGTGMNAVAAAAGFAVLWPEQSPSANPRRCWRWFDAAHQGRLGGEPATILALAAAVADAERLDGARIFVAGLSAGGAMAAVLADSGDPHIAAIAVHSGLAAASASNMAAGLAAMRQPAAPRKRPGSLVPTLILHGIADQVVAPANADLLFDQAVLQADRPLSIETIRTRDGQRTIARAPSGRRLIERYLIDRLGHAWAGGSPAGSHTSPDGPDASARIVGFFAEHAERG